MTGGEHVAVLDAFLRDLFPMRNRRNAPVLRPNPIRELTGIWLEDERPSRISHLAKWTSVPPIVVDRPDSDFSSILFSLNEGSGFAEISSVNDDDEMGDIIGQ